MMIAVLGLMIAGRLASLLVYQMTWRNGTTCGHCPLGATAALLLRPYLWPLHVAMIWPVAGMSWDGMPAMRLYASASAMLLALGAVGRLGCDGRGRFFLTDRLLAFVLALCVPFSPAFLYPAVVATCCLQYTVAWWPLGPGYSNLLGHEFMRGSLCVACSALAISGWTGMENEAVMLAAVIGWQASTYVDHALAKCALGPKWHSWIRENRLQCLIVNAWLRGWKAVGNRDRILSLAAFIGRWRVAFCAIAWCIEIAWLLVLVDSRVACVILMTTLVFHLVVLWLTGLLAWHYMANHLVLIVLIGTGMSGRVFDIHHWLGALAGILVTAPWVGLVRSRMLTEFRKDGRMRRWGLLGDPADHLMAWWDTPLMRMFGYSVTTASGRLRSLPVTKLSPHDTTLTDLHTHMMILGLHAGLDPQAADDRALAPNGVWGLTIDRDARNFLYRAMDGAEELPARWFEKDTRPWRVDGGESCHAAAIALQDTFREMNRHIGKPWYRVMMRWPHFPGEDLVPDICPLVTPVLPEFRFEENISAVTIWRVRTFYDGTSMRLVSHEAMGEIQVHLTK